MAKKFTPVDLTLDLPIYRYFRGEPDAADPNTFQVRMASEWPAEQLARAEHVRLGIAKKEGDPYMEVLSHAEGDVDLSRVTGDNRGALLDEHFDNRHLGYIKSAALSKDGVTRAAITFDLKSKLSTVRRAQVAANDRPYFSAGYKQTKYLGAEPQSDGSTHHRFAWQALELSNVAVPADPTARKGRAAAKGECRCIRCGDVYDRSALNEEMICTDCADAETPAEGDRSENSENKDVHAFSAMDYRKKNPKKDDELTTNDPLSHNEMHDALRTALDSHPDFKRSRPNGDTFSDFRIHDVHSYVGDSDTEHVAYVESPSWSGQYRSIDFTYEDGAVELGDSEEVEPKVTFEAVERGLTMDGRILRKDKKPYGNVKYADPGYQKDGKARYPIDTAEHAKAAWSYINQQKNASKYSSGDLAKVKSKIKAACKKFGVEISEEKEKKADAPSLRITRGNEILVVPISGEGNTPEPIGLTIKINGRAQTIKL